MNERCNDEPCAINDYPRCEERIPTREVSKYEINIQPLDVGYVVRVGCQTIAFTNLEKMLFNLTDYLNNPRVWQEKWESSKELL